MKTPKFLRKSIIPFILFFSLLSFCILNIQTTEYSVDIHISTDTQVTSYCQEAITPDVYLVKILVTNILELVSLSDIKAV